MAESTSACISFSGIASITFWSWWIMNMNFIAFSSLAKLLDRARLDAGLHSTGLWGEACALERSDASERIGAQLGGEGVQGLERALDRGAGGGGVRGHKSTPTCRAHESECPP